MPPIFTQIDLKVYIGSIDEKISICLYLSFFWFDETLNSLWLNYILKRPLVLGLKRWKR